MIVKEIAKYEPIPTRPTAMSLYRPNEFGHDRIHHIRDIFYHFRYICYHFRDSYYNFRDKKISLS